MDKPFFHCVCSFVSATKIENVLMTEITKQDIWFCLMFKIKWLPAKWLTYITGNLNESTFDIIYCVFYFSCIYLIMKQCDQF